MFKPEPFVTRLAFAASDRPEAQEAKAALIARYGQASAEDAQVIVALGGDGFMLETLHENLTNGRPIYGMNRGSVGFLMNEYSEDGLLERIAAAEQAVIHPLSMRAVDITGARHEALAINEVSLLRQTRQTAKLRISIDGKVRLAELSCDGALVATPAGSTAYNLSAGGPLVYPGLATITVTPICPFMLGSRPIILPADMTIATRYQATGSNERAQVIIDGQPFWEMADGDQLEIKTARHFLRLVVSSSRDYFTILRNKLHWGSPEQSGRR